MRNNNLYFHIQANYTSELLDNNENMLESEEPCRCGTLTVSWQKVWQPKTVTNNLGFY